MFSTLFQVTIDLQKQANVVSPIQNFDTFFTGGLRAVLIVGAMLTFFYMILGALDWITAGGDSGKVDSGRKKITQAIIGLFVLASVWVIFLAVQYFLGIRVLRGGGAGSSGSGGGGASTCAGGVAINSIVNDAGAGGYCELNGQPTAANVKCVAAGAGPSQFPYPHFEPVSCVSGVKSWDWAPAN